MNEQGVLKYLWDYTDFLHDAPVWIKENIEEELGKQEPVTGDGEVIKTLIAAGAGKFRDYVQVPHILEKLGNFDKVVVEDTITGGWAMFSLEVVE